MTVTTPELPRNLSAGPQQQLADIVSRWAQRSGISQTAIGGVELYRSDGLTPCASTVYEPSLIFILQGTKTIQLGDREIVYGPMSYLASSVHLPVQGQIVDACQARPYLAAKITVDPQEVTDLVLELGGLRKPLPLQPRKQPHVRRAAQGGCVEVAGGAAGS